jgi:hypothetical protein
MWPAAGHRTCSGITLAAAAFLVRPTGPLLALAAAFALASFSLCRRLHRGYVLALEASLRSGAVKLDPEEVRDGTTLAVSRSALGIDRQTLLDEIRARVGRALPTRHGGPFLRSVADPLGGRWQSAVPPGGGLVCLVSHVIHCSRAT